MVIRGEVRLNPGQSQCTLGVLYVLLIFGESSPNLFTHCPLSSLNKPALKVKNPFWCHSQKGPISAGPFKEESLDKPGGSKVLCVCERLD